LARAALAKQGVAMPVALYEGTVIERQLYPSGHLEELYRQGAQLQPL
jgi:hypothetical protein